MQHATVYAPDFTGGRGWLNTAQPLSIKDLRGKVVLLDFWTFCCINCMHVIPDLKRLEHKYADELVVVGVHSAKFDNEKDTAAIREAVLRYGIEHPVVNDADFQIWQAYAVSAWPTLVLIDPDGHVVGQVSGEGNYEVLDKAIGQLVERFEGAGKLDRKPLELALESARVEQSPLAFPGKLLADAKGGRLFVSDSGHNRIVVSDLKGSLLSTIGSGRQGDADGDFASASFNHPQGLALQDEVLYIADTENHLIRAAYLKSGKVSTIAGSGHQAAARGGGGKARQTALSSPWDLVFAGGKLYIAMAGPHQLWVMDLERGEIEPYAGSGREDIIDGSLQSAALAQPSGITTDGKKLYFADSEVSAVRSADLAAGGRVHTLVGEGLFAFGDQDGDRKRARLQHPLGVLFHEGKLYVADSYNHKVKIIDPETETVRSFIGTGAAGRADSREPLKVQLSEPGGLSAAGGRLFIADTNNNAVRVAELATGAVSTLVVKGLAPPAPAAAVESSVRHKPSDKPALPPNAQKLVLPESELKPSTSGEIVVDVSFPRGFHLNKEASLNYNLVGLAGDAVQIEKGHFAGKIDPPELPFKIPFKTLSAGRSGSINLGVTVYYCSEGDGSVCKVKSLLIEAPVKVTDSAQASDLSVSCAVKD